MWWQLWTMDWRTLLWGMEGTNLASFSSLLIFFVGEDMGSVSIQPFCHQPGSPTAWERYQCSKAILQQSSLCIDSHRLSTSLCCVFCYCCSIPMNSLGHKTLNIPYSYQNTSMVFKWMLVSYLPNSSANNSLAVVLQVHLWIKEKLLVSSLLIAFLNSFSLSPPFS
jgi:predicted Co/Zn/Cd cation transporter (cation efflux family)